MGAGTFALTITWLLLGQAPPVYHTNQRELQIPITLNDTIRGELKDLLLFASWDQGQNYQQVVRVPPESSKFIFKADNDGTCWVKVAVMNRQGKQEPDNIQQGPPDQIIVIDTMKPVVRAFTAQRQGDDVVVAWEILESHFDPQGFRLEYQPRENPSAFWTNIPVQAAPGLSGQQRFRPSSPGPLLLRLSAKDQAGNQSVQLAEVTGGITAVSYSPPTAPAPGKNNELPAVIPPPSPPPTTLSNSSAPPLPIEAVKQPGTPPNTWAPTAGAVNEPKERLVATSDAPRHPTPAPALPPATNLVPPVETRKPLPPLQYVNHPEVLLEYKLSKVGKSGVGSVDLWWTRNDGQSWELYATDTKIRGTTQNGLQEATVELPGEGVYGFILVVKSQAGLGKPAPRPGDLPEIRVEVDTTSPLAQLFAPAPDGQRSGALTLKWVAKDTNLTNNPVTLEWAEKREGPWVSIATDIPNSGRYSWQLPDALPVQVYMRLRVRDLAGNESIAVTQDPQLVDLSEPEGTLVNVSALRGHP